MAKISDEEFMEEYIARLAWYLVHFWPYGEDLPDSIAKADEQFYNRAIQRLSFSRRQQLVAEMHWHETDESGTFAAALPPAERKQIVDGVLDRFGALRDAERDIERSNRF
jgi:hypothetical protein